MPQVQFPYAIKAAKGPDPVPVYKFWVEIGGIVVAEFQECSGLRMERAFETVEEGGVNDYVHILPGRNKYSNITLKNGAIYSNELWNWYQKSLQSLEEKPADSPIINFSILLRNVEGKICRRWNIQRAFPVKWEGPQLNTDSSQIAVETIEIAHHGIILDTQTK